MTDAAKERAAVVAWLRSKVVRMSAAIARDRDNHYVPDAAVIVRLAGNWADAIGRGDHLASCDRRRAAGETADAGSIEDESAVPSEETADAQPLTSE